MGLFFFGKIQFSAIRSCTLCRERTRFCWQFTTLQKAVETWLKPVSQKYSYKRKGNKCEQVMVMWSITQHNYEQVVIFEESDTGQKNGQVTYNVWNVNTLCVICPCFCPVSAPCNMMNDHQLAFALTLVSYEKVNSWEGCVTLRCHSPRRETAKGQILSRIQNVIDIFEFLGSQLLNIDKKLTENRGGGKE